MVLQNGQAASDIRQRDDDMSIESTWSRKSLVQRFGDIRGANDDNTLGLSKPVKFDEELVQSLLQVRCVARIAPGTDGVELVDEDDGGSVLSGGGEKFAHTPSSDADVHLVKLGPGSNKEVLVRR
jgi:hypothetical protein